MSERDWVLRHAALLIEQNPGGITLDAVGEIVGAQAVTPAAIEALFDELEARGIEVQDGLSAELSTLLKVVLSAARELRLRGERLSPGAVASASGRTEREVRVALLFAQVLER